MKAYFLYMWAYHTPYVIHPDGVISRPEKRKISGIWEVVSLRVLWLCNIIPVQISRELNISHTSAGGWITSLFHEICHVKEIELAVVAPIAGKQNQVIEHKISNVVIYGFLSGYPVTRYDKNLEKRFADILSKFRPDFVHIFGTEFPHTLAMVRAFGNPKRTIIQIQGLVSVCAQHYTLGLPEKECRKKSFRDLLRNDSINQAKKRFEVRGRYEIAAIKGVSNIIGRTDWDKACALQIHPKARYFYCPEILREEFYEGACWKYDRCESHSLFMSQAYYPIKGIHFVLKAMSILKHRYPKMRLNIAGTDILSLGIRKDYYTKMILKLIQTYDLRGQIRFLGILDADGMKEQYLRANVFVSASTIENESNSLSEAKMLGVPCIASFVGGVTGRIMHGKDGFLYPADEPYMLAHYIGKIFESKSLAENLSVNAKCAAMEMNNRRQNVDRLLNIYNQVAGLKE